MRLLLAVLLLSSCARSQDFKIPVGDHNKKHAVNEAVATFSEGCFWHSELVFQSLVGVRDAVSGYAGGNYTDPTYETVATGGTGHAETVQVYYDSTKISYPTLVAAFFASQNPTQMNAQGNDVGTEYRSIAFYHTAQQKQVIEAEMKRLTDAHKYKAPIVTEVVPFTHFYPAEKYHQEYISLHPDESYVSNVCIPEFLEFKQEFKEGSFK
jgi:peptide-methionine (S)-S-oxide reductase